MRLEGVCDASPARRMCAAGVRAKQRAGHARRDGRRPWPLERVVIVAEACEKQRASIQGAVHRGTWEDPITPSPATSVSFQSCRRDAHFSRRDPRGLSQRSQRHNARCSFPAASCTRDSAPLACQPLFAPPPSPAPPPFIPPCATPPRTRLRPPPARRSPRLPLRPWPPSGLTSPLTQHPRPRPLNWST